MPNGAILTTLGKSAIISAMLVGVCGDFIAHGTGTGAAAAANTALGTGVDLDAGKAWAVTSSAKISTNTYRSIYTMACGATRSITEVGLFDAAVFGTTHILYREVFAAMAVNSGDTVLYTVDLVVA